MKKGDIYALGVGASTPVFFEIAEDYGYNIAGLFHYENGRTGEIVCGKKIIGSFEDLFNSDIRGMNFLLTMGDIAIRKNLTERIDNLGGFLPTIIHPLARISPNAQISSQGVVIGPMAIVQAGACIEKGVVVRDMALVCHNAIVEQFCFIGPKALVGAFAHISNSAFIGQSATLVSRKVKNVGQNSLIGAGAIVVHDVPDNVIAFGNPAKIKGND